MCDINGNYILTNSFYIRSIQTPEVTTYSRISDLLCTVEGIRHYLSKTIEVWIPMCMHAWLQSYK